MAIFNPAVPDTKDPRFGGDYQAIKQPHFTSATAEAFKTGTEVMGQALKGSDEIIKAFATDDTRRAMEGERARYTAYLDDMDARVRGNVINGPPNAAKTTINQQAADQAPMDILPNGEAVPPSQDLRNFPKKLAALQGARASGKMPETEYYANTDAILSDVRSRYMIGYRDWIDEQAEKILGFKSANKVIQSKLADINSFLGTKNDENKAIEGQFRSMVSDGTGGDRTVGAYKRFREDHDIDAAELFISRENQFKARLAVQEANKKLYENHEEGKAQMAEKNFIDNHKLQASYWFQDLDAEFKSKGVTKDALGNWNIPENQKDLVGQMILNKKNQFEQFLRMNASQEDQNGDSLISLRKPAVVNAHIKELSQQFTDAADRVYNKESGQIGMVARHNAAVQNDATMTVFQKLPFVPVMKAIRDSAGDAASAVFFAQGAKVPSAIKEFFEASSVQFAGAETNNPWSLKQSIDQATVAAIPMQKQYNNVFIDSIVGKAGLLGEGKDDFKARLAAGIASPKNIGILADVEPEYTDMFNKYHPGRIDMWKTLTSEDVAKETARVSKAVAKPEIFETYKNTWTTEFRNGIFKQDLDLLKELPAGVKLTWDDKAIRWDVTSQRPDITGTAGERELRRAGFRGSTDPVFDRIKQTVEHLNSGIKGIKNIAEAADVDANAAVLELFRDVGYDLTKSGYDNIPGYMIESIKRQRITHAEEEARKAKEAERLRK